MESTTEFSEQSIISQRYQNTTNFRSIIFKEVTLNKILTSTPMDIESIFIARVIMAFVKFRKEQRLSRNSFWWFYWLQYWLAWSKKHRKSKNLAIFKYFIENRIIDFNKIEFKEFYSAFLPDSMNSKIILPLLLQ